MLKKYFDEFTRHLLEDDKPSIYFRKIEDEDFLITNIPLQCLAG